MKHKTHIATIGAAILVCVLALPLAAQVTRPYKITGETVGVITEVTADYTITFDLVNVGQATHCGRYWNVGTTTLSLITHRGTAQGIFTAANGDLIEWEGVIAPTVDGRTILTVTVTGGTGRFADGSGGFVAEISNFVIDPMPPAVGSIVSYTFEGAGAASY